MVPVRGETDLFGAAEYVTVPSPLPDPPSTTVSQSESLTAVQAKLGTFAFTVIEPSDLRLRMVADEGLRPTGPVRLESICIRLLAVSRF